jgi:hypothetical protein
MKCWFASLPGAGPCDGRLVRCHLIPKQTIVREVRPGGVRASWDDRVWVWGCGGPTGLSGPHGMLDSSRTLRIPRARLPPSVESFAVDHGLGWWLDREYGVRCERNDSSRDADALGTRNDD